MSAACARFGSTFTVAVVALVAAQARAEVPPMSPAALQSEAELIVTGTIERIDVVRATPAWVADSRDIAPSQRAQFLDAHYTVTMRVKHVDKGEFDAQAQPLAFHGWRVAQRPGGGWVGPSGTLKVDATVGEPVKAYLKRENGAWALFSYSGFVPLDHPLDHQ